MVRVSQARSEIQRRRKCRSHMVLMPLEPVTGSYRCPQHKPYLLVHPPASASCASARLFRCTPSPSPSGASLLGGLRLPRGREGERDVKEEEGRERKKPRPRTDNLVRGDPNTWSLYICYAWKQSLWCGWCIVVRGRLCQPSDPVRVIVPAMSISDNEF